MKLMRSAAKTKEIAEYGDFQTPVALAREICATLARSGIQPKTIIEPTCGIGNILQAALEVFPACQHALGLEISNTYVTQARVVCGNGKVVIRAADFLQTDWRETLRDLPEPFLVIGNPPWVTNSQLSVLGSRNVPEKTNFQLRQGYEAMTGKSNFDLSEWMLLQLLNALNGRSATLAMLCKTTVARKVLRHAWQQRVALSSSAMYNINAARHFGAAVDACLLVCQFTPQTANVSCQVFADLQSGKSSHAIGFRDGQLVASLELYERWRHLQGSGGRWRSGVKHDCSKVMELAKEGDKYRNGLGELAQLEDDFVYPLLKSSDLSRGVETPRRWILITQKAVNQNTFVIKETARRTWAYLEKHGELLDGRGSVIYRKRPRFSVFGVGDYSFTDWKVAISGFYKKLQFRLVGPHQGRPVLFDDTVYFLPCATRAEAEELAARLNSNIAKEFFSAFIFWESKRPITTELLQKLDLTVLRRVLENHHL
jgi:hypothetical protein